MDLLASMEWRHPWLLLATLAALPTYLWARRAPGRVVFSSLAVLPPRAGGWRLRLDGAPDLLLALAALLLGVALAGPRVGDKTSRVEREGIAIMMVVDISGSMQALDLSTRTKERTRLDAVKDVFAQFVHGGGGLAGRPNDAMGIVTFARYADTPCPLTLDHGNLATVARRLEIVSDRNEDGTAMGDGLGLAVERLRGSPARSKVAIMLSDGVNNAGVEPPLAAAELAKTQGVKVYTVGAGTNGTAPVRVQDPFTGQKVLQAVQVEIDEKTLQEIATRTGGRYFRATDAQALLDVYKEIDRLERTELTEEKYRAYHEYYPTLVAWALLLACLAFLARGTVLRRLP
jgi:Ca-activated chloride channel family protein